MSLSHPRDRVRSRGIGLLTVAVLLAACAGQEAASRTTATTPSTAVSAPTARPLRVACIGEQTTHSAHREYDPEYPQRLGDLLGARFQVKNFGLPKGMVLRQGKAPGSEPYLGSRAHAESLAFAPDIVLVGPWGRHDTYKGNWPEHQGDFEADLQALLTSYTALPNRPLVLVVLPLPLSGEPRPPMADLVAPTRRVAAALGLPTVDLWAAFLGQAALYKDSTHLLPDGQQRQAQLMADAIRPLEPQLAQRTARPR